jgi:hypothetical protein
MNAKIAKKENTKRTLTPEARLSYPYLFERQRPMTGDGEGKYSCELIFGAGLDLSALKAAAEAAAREKWGDKIPKGLRSPFRDGAERDGKAGYDNCVFVTAKSTTKPEVITGRDQRQAEPDDIYGGCVVRASLTAYAYDHAGNRGVSFALNSVWKLRDGEQFATRVKAADEFAGVEIDADSFGAHDLI